jgi:malate dehydrogenase (oxaloacetate-decarboxylating)(NADP+)
MFTQPILEAMLGWNKRPIIFSLSNPTSKSECTAEEAYRWTNGRAIFASGSPFDPVTLNGQTFMPAQGNNAYIFPGVGLGVVVSGARLVTDEMFMVAAKTLAAEVAASDLANGRIYPPLHKIRDVSAKIATAIATIAYQNDLATLPQPADLTTAVREQMYEPDYQAYLS